MFVDWPITAVTRESSFSVTTLCLANYDHNWIVHDYTIFVYTLHPSPPSLPSRSTGTPTIEQTQSCFSHCYSVSLFICHIHSDCMSVCTICTSHTSHFIIHDSYTIFRTVVFRCSCVMSVCAFSLISCLYPRRAWGYCSCLVCVFGGVLLSVV